MVTLVGALFVMTIENSKPLNVLTRFVTAVICADTPDAASAFANGGGGVTELLGELLPQPTINKATAINNVEVDFIIIFTLFFIN